MNKSSKINAKTFIIMAFLVLALLIAVAASSELFNKTRSFEIKHKANKIALGRLSEKITKVI